MSRPGKPVPFNGPILSSIRDRRGADTTYYQRDGMGPVLALALLRIRALTGAVLCVPSRPRKEEDGLASTMTAPDKLRQVAHCPGCGAPLISVPVLQCTRCRHPHPLRAFTYGPKAGLYFAECIDLDLLTQGATAEEAIGKLQEAMYGYLETAFAGDSTRGLVMRPSPVSHRLRYYLHRLRCLLSLPRHARRGTHLVMPTSVLGGQRLSHC
jgi:predicted RNase H-like HicB family nuclease